MSPSGPPAAGLVAVPVAQVMSAVHRAGERNPLLGTGTGAPTGGVPAVHWHPPQATGVATGLVDAVGEWLRTDEPRVAASMVVLGYAARLVGPAVAVLMRDNVLLDLRPSQVMFSYAPDRGFRLTLSSHAGWSGPAGALHRGWCRVVVDAHLRLVVDAVRTVVPVAAGLLWGNVASGLAGALAALAREGAVSPADCYATGRALLDHGPLRGTGRLSIEDGQLRFMRRSCCLYYRLDGGGMCADCALLPAR